MTPLPDPTKSFANQEVTCLVTQALFGEVLNQDDYTRAAMGCAARNRLIHYRPEYGIRDWPGILLKHGQFDCFVSLKDKLMNPLKYEKQDTWDHLYEIAKTILNGAQTDSVERCTHYFDSSLDNNKPYWARSPLMEHIKDIGQLRFYRYIENHPAHFTPESFGEE